MCACAGVVEGEGGNVEMRFRRLVRGNTEVTYHTDMTGGARLIKNGEGEGSSSAEGVIPASRTSHRFGAVRDFIDSTSSPPPRFPS